MPRMTIKPSLLSGHHMKKTRLKKGDVIFYNRESKVIQMTRRGQKIYIGYSSVQKDEMAFGIAMDACQFMEMAQFIAATAGLGIQHHKSASYGESYIFC